MDDQQRARDQFEEWCKGRYNLTTRQDSLGNGVYVERWVQGAWVGFRAALRAAPEVPAARVTEPLRADESRQEQADSAIYNRGWNDCRAAMLAARPQGVK